MSKVLRLLLQRLQAYAVEQPNRGCRRLRCFQLANRLWRNRLVAPIGIFETHIKQDISSCAYVYQRIMYTVHRNGLLCMWFCILNDLGTRRHWVCRSNEDSSWWLDCLSWYASVLRVQPSSAVVLMFVWQCDGLSQSERLDISILICQLKFITLLKCRLHAAMYIHIEKWIWACWKRDLLPWIDNNDWESDTTNIKVWEWRCAKPLQDFISIAISRLKYHRFSKNDRFPIKNSSSCNLVTI